MGSTIRGDSFSNFAKFLIMRAIKEISVTYRMLHPIATMFIKFNFIKFIDLL